MSFVNSNDYDDLKSLGSTKKEEKKAPEIKKHKGKVVLEEEEYYKSLEDIIQRHFFPELEKINTKTEYLEALETGNAIKMQKVLYDYRLARQKTEAGFQKTPNTPLFLGATPVPGLETAEMKKYKRDSKFESLSLDQFQMAFTSEDNASFSDIMEENRQQKRQKYQWMFDPEKKILSLQDKKEIQKIEFDDKSKPVVNWKFTAKNALMFHPESNRSLLIDDPREGEKSIQHANTRFQPTITATDLPQSSNSLLQIKSMTPSGELHQDQTPLMNGYRYVNPSPSPLPQKGATPLFTWGTIEETPLSLDAEQQQIELELSQEPKEDNKQFKLPPLQKRELLGNRLAEEARTKSNAATGKSPLQKRKLTPTTKSKFNTLSPAAQHFLRHTQKASSNSQSTPLLFRKPQ